MAFEETTGKIIEAAMKVHTALEPGLLESAYQACLLFNFHVERLGDGLKRMVNG